MAISASSGSKILKELGVATTVNLGLNTVLAAKNYKESRAEGDGRIASFAKAGSEFALNYVLGNWLIPFQLAPVMPKAIVGGVEAIGKYERNMNRANRRIPFANSNFNDFQQAFTMRQAGMQLAENSRYNLQQAILGNESTYLR